MIQRIQSLWLFLAALIGSLTLLDWYTGYVYKADVPNGLGATVSYLRVTDHFPTLIVVVAMIIVPFITIFFFKDRKRQKSLSWVALLLCVSFISVSLMRIENFKNQSPMPKNGSYQAGIVVPVVSMVFVIMAIGGIRRDDKLVKSMDRLR